MTNKCSFAGAQRRGNPSSRIATPSFLGLAMTNNSVKQFIHFVARRDDFVGRKKAQKAQETESLFCAFCAFLRLVPLFSFGCSEAAVGIFPASRLETCGSRRG